MVKGPVYGSSRSSGSLSSSHTRGNALPLNIPRNLTREGTSKEPRTSWESLRDSGEYDGRGSYGRYVPTSVGAVFPTHQGSVARVARFVRPSIQISQIRHKHKLGYNEERHEGAISITRTLCFDYASQPRPFPLWGLAANCEVSPSTIAGESFATWSGQRSYSFLRPCSQSAPKRSLHLLFSFFELEKLLQAPEPKQICWTRELQLQPGPGVHLSILSTSAY